MIHVTAVNGTCAGVDELFGRTQEMAPRLPDDHVHWPSGVGLRSVSC